MKSSAILRRAAELVDGDHDFQWPEYLGRESNAIVYMWPLMADYEMLRRRPSMKGWNGPERVVGLCLAAAIAESEGD